MVQQETNTGKPEQSSPLNLIPAEFAAMGKKRIEDLIDMQSDLLEQLQETNRNWLDRVQLETSLASELATKLTAARSIPESTTAFQEWANKRMEMVTEDGKRLIADTQKLMTTGTRFWSNGWQPNGRRSVGT